MQSIQYHRAHCFLIAVVRGGMKRAQARAMMYHSPGFAVVFMVEFIGSEASSHTTPFTNELEQLPRILLSFLGFTR